MEPKSSLTHIVSNNLSGNHHWGYGRPIPEHVTSQQRWKSTGRKRSSVRLNDQLIPKPTDVNVAENLINVPTLKEHPYSSHISRFAVFPSFSSPDDPERGVRAASQAFPNRFIPKKAPDVTVISKAIGGPYRREILQTPANARRTAVSWPGENGFLDNNKFLKEGRQVFYPAPPKTVMPNPKLRDWDLSLSERTSNMLKNLERSLWVTSYQMHYTGSGPADLLKIDDFREKITNFPRLHSHSAPLRDRSYSVLVPSKPKQSSTWDATTAGLQYPAPNQNTASAFLKEPQETTATHNETPVSNQMSGSQSKYRTQQVEENQQAERKCSGFQGRERRNRKIWFDETLMQESESPSCQEAAAAASHLSNAERHWDLNNHQSDTDISKGSSLIKLKEKELLRRNIESPVVENSLRVHQSAVAKDQIGSGSHEALLSGSSSEEEGKVRGRDLLHSVFNTGPHITPGIHQSDLLELQHSFSKSETHRNFNSSVTPAAVNLRDNVVSGKKHNFFGINCNYIHG